MKLRTLRMTGRQGRQIPSCIAGSSYSRPRAPLHLTESQGVRRHYGLAAGALVPLGLSRLQSPRTHSLVLLLDGVFTPIANLRPMCDAVVKL